MDELSEFPKRRIAIQISLLYIGKLGVAIFLEGQLEIHQLKVSGKPVHQRFSDHSVVYHFFAHSDLVEAANLQISVGLYYPWVRSCQFVKVHLSFDCIRTEGPT